MVTNPTVVAMADIPIRIVQARRKRSSMMARIMRAPSRLYSSHAFNSDSFNKCLPCSNRHQFCSGDVGEVPLR